MPVGIRPARGPAGAKSTSDRGKSSGHSCRSDAGDRAECRHGDRLATAGSGGPTDRCRGSGPLGVGPCGATACRHGSATQAIPGDQPSRCRSNRSGSGGRGSTTRESPRRLSHRCTACPGRSHRGVPRRCLSDRRESPSRHHRRRHLRPCDLGPGDNLARWRTALATSGVQPSVARSGAYGWRCAGSGQAG